MKRIFWIFLIAGLLIMPVVAAESADSDIAVLSLPVEDEVIAGGSLTETVFWEIREDDLGERTLRISGSGPMADYVNADGQPWAKLRSTVRHVVIEDGVTRIGNYTFHNTHLDSVEIGKDVEVIGVRAFGYGSGLGSITIPGTVKVVEENAFAYHSGVTSVVLEEGIETIGAGAFNTQAGGSATIHIPASVTSIGTPAFATASHFTVEKDNVYYTALDGVLYNKDMTILLEYPRRRIASEFRVPDSVVEIKYQAMRDLQKTKKIYVPSTVQKLNAGYVFCWSEIEEVYIEDGVVMEGTHSFQGCSKLSKVRLPENTHISIIDNMLQSAAHGLESFKIPNGTKKIYWIGDSLPSLSELIYDAQDAVIRDGNVMDSTITYNLVIGSHVDILPKEFKWISSQAESLQFETENQFEVEEGAFTNLSSPFCDLSGSVYVDGQGVIYGYDKEKNSAKVVYCQKGKEEIVIPETIEPESGIICTVTSVGANAFRDAKGLIQVTFLGKDKISKIASYGFANCTTLSEINGGVTVEGATASFSMAADNIGYRAFYNTGLKDAVVSGNFLEKMDGCKSLQVKKEGIPNLKVTVSSDGGTIEWKENTELADTGGYHLLTGDTLTVVASAGNTESTEEFLYRVYFQMLGEDGVLNISKGQTYTFDGQEASCYGTEDPSTVYLEFAPGIGETISVPVTCVYPSPTSAGGGLVVWAMAFSKEEAEVLEEKIILSDGGMIQAYWKTKEDTFTVMKTSTGNQKISLVGDSDGNVKAESNLEWKIVLQRENEVTSAYGKNYVKVVYYEDILSFPQGLDWKEEVVKSVKSGDTKFFSNILYAGDTAVLKLTLSGGSLSLVNVDLIWDEEREDIVLKWRTVNRKSSAEMNTNTLNLSIYSDGLSADVNEVLEAENLTIINTVNATVKHYYDVEEKRTSKAEKTVEVKSGNIKLTKTCTKAANYFGEPLNYLIKLNNSGGLYYTASEAGSWVLEDELSVYSYISPENMERMFKENKDMGFQILISNAELMPWEERKGIYEGTTSWKNVSNAGVNDKTLGTQDIAICRNKEEELYEVSVGDNEVKGDSLPELLKQIGYGVTRWTRYKIVWELNESTEVFRLSAGETREFQVYANAKDTFMMLSKDWPGSYPTDAAISITNNVTVFNEKSVQMLRNSAYSNVKKEIYVDKTLSVDGQVKKESFTVENGQVLDYKLQFKHYGKGDYENLPVVDDMYGTQYLLVPVENNPELKDNNLEIFKIENEAFYILAEGQYEDVAVGVTENDKNCIAARIIVKKAEEETSVETGEEKHSYTGLHTRIEWYYPQLESGNYRMTISYQALTDKTLAESNAYTIGNVAWWNDRAGSRIFASLWGGGTLIDFSKDIVTTKGVFPSFDGIDEDGYSLIGPGDTVTYRLTLRNKDQGHYFVNGKDIVDRLPQNGGVFSWEKGKNIELSYYSTHSSTRLNGMDQWTIGDNWDDLEEEGQQYIFWPEDTEIEFSEADAKVYLYVTLTYPDNEKDARVWDSYCDVIKGGTLVNTFYVYYFPVNVTHQLKEAGQILLQKGVYGTSYGNANQYVETQSRIYYNNRDSRNRQISYYVVLYNGGNKRFYLDYLYDTLPQGFSFEKMAKEAYFNDNTITTSIMTKDTFGERPLIDISYYGADIENVVYKNAAVELISNKDGLLCFEIGKGSGDEPVRYDAERERYYLAKNEAIVFGYMCDIGTSENTADEAVNGIMMPYIDYLNTGTNAVEKNQIGFYGAISEEHTDQNDGNCEIVSSDLVKKRDELNKVDHSGLWIMSEAVVRRGGIIPGVTKYTEAYSMAGNPTLIEYKGSVSPFDTIYWKSRLHNGGTLSMTDYTFTDILPAPYVFTGTVHYSIYDYQEQLMAESDIFEFYERKDGAITIKMNNEMKQIESDGEWVEVTLPSGHRMNIALGLDKDGNETLKIHFSLAGMSIPEGGYVDVSYASVNPTTNYRNTVYTNRAYLTPNVQPFDAVSQGSMIRDEEGKPAYAMNSAPVTVSMGYATGSKKIVMENENSENRADSTNPDKNYILLSSEESGITYELMVTNDTSLAMEKLVFLDALPKPGDTSPFDTAAPRNSAFKVKLSDNPAFKVVVTLQDGTSYELEETYYEVSYTQESEFTKEDWDGTSVWDGEAENASAFRVVITDKTGEKIPKKAKVSLLFECEIDGDAEPGTIAWNSFGYHYKLEGVDQELEAMPLCVGVKVPSIPKLQKKLIGYYGDEIEADEDKEFSFVLYEGEALGEDVSPEELIETLKESSIPYREVKVPVKKGSSVSTWTTLEWEDWNWIQGTAYTIVEVSTDERYEFHSLNDQHSKLHTFIYNADKEEMIICANKDMDSKGYILPKAGGKGTAMYTMAGLLLLSSLLCLMYKRKSGQKNI